MNIKGKTWKFGKGLVDVYECSICGWRYVDRNPEKCENPKCHEEKIR
jgi:rubrerythrin